MILFPQNCLQAKFYNGKISVQLQKLHTNLLIKYLKSISGCSAAW